METRDGGSSEIVAASAVYELGTREQLHGMPVQPFSDG
jgi:hypothetical protein